MSQNKLPLVTIAIPTYNRADTFLPQAARSALAQTYANTEIIIADNCSTDNTQAFVRSISNSRIRYFKHPTNMRANDNFNFCLQQAKGDYFLLLHDDDLIDPDFVALCLDAAGYQTDIGIIRTGMRRIDSSGRVLHNTPNLAVGLSTDDFFLAWFRGKTPMHLCCALFNTAMLRSIGGFRSKRERFQDVIAQVTLAANFSRIDIPSIKASFRQHASQTTRSVSITEWCEDSLELLTRLCELAPGKQFLIRTQGLKFFSRHNYRIARTIKSPVGRSVSYWKIFKMFEYSVSPFRFLVDQNVIAPLRRWATTTTRLF